MGYSVSFSCVSHIGRCRGNNQDNYLCNGRFAECAQPMTDMISGTVDLRKPVLFGVYDGMGGEECGERASYIAAKTAAAYPFGKNSVRDLSDYCAKANEAICAYAEKQELSSMGTTAVMLLLTRKGITLCNIGDSKAFRFSGGKCEQISQDHVMPTSFGKKPPLSQNLGIPPSEMRIEPFVSKGPYGRGDRYLLCSDGLTDMVSVEQMAQIVHTYPSEQAVQVLLEKALEAGGKDNITILMLTVERAKSTLWPFR